jgi:hypothetical protein
MADSKREAIMKRIAAVLAGTAGVSGRVYRSEPEALDRDNHPCILLRWTNEQATPETVLQSERTLTVYVDILVRGDVPDSLADPIAQSVHALLMADPRLNGLALDTMLGDASFEYESADQTAGKLTHEYMVKFRHSWADMTI